MQLSGRVLDNLPGSWVQYPVPQTKPNKMLSMVAHATVEGEARVLLSLRPAWATLQDSV